jgi:hypothetical protein
MRTCPKCLAENADTDRFCRQCTSALQQSGGKTCPTGRHTMDPTWTECAYCKQENNVIAPGPPPPVRKATVVESGLPPRGAPPRPATLEAQPPVLPPRTPRPLNPAAGPPSPPPVTGQQIRARAHTEFRPIPSPGSDGGQSAKAAPAVHKDRKVVGVLVSYSWTPEGQIFPIREGRNFIGRDPDCEVSVPQDQTMSGRNSHITYRQNFVVGDMVSMTGTDVDEIPIEEQFRSLANYSVIRAGSTYFTFIAIKPPSGTGADETSTATGFTT